MDQQEELHQFENRVHMQLFLHQGRQHKEDLLLRLFQHSHHLKYVTENLLPDLIYYT